MDDIIEEITKDNKLYYNYTIQFGKFINYYFNTLLNVEEYNKIINKFNNLKTKYIIEYSYLNKKKILFKNTNKIIFYKNDFVKCYLIKNTNNNNNNCNYFLFKEKKINKIQPYEFPNIKEKIIIENKKISTYKSIYYNTEININFIEINNDIYSINIDINFDIKNKKNIILHLNKIYKKIFNNFNFIQL